MKVSDLITIYDENVTFIDPIAEHQGLPAVEEYFARLLKNAKHCNFTIHSTETASSDKYVVTWTMNYSSARMNSGKGISLDGITLLQTSNDKIIFHRDYYDLGQMVYENIPLLGRIIKKIKRSMA